MSPWKRMLKLCVDESLSTDLEENLIGSEEIYVGLYQTHHAALICIVAERRARIVVLGFREFGSLKEMQCYLDQLKSDYHVEYIAAMRSDMSDVVMLPALSLAIEAHRRSRPWFYRAQPKPSTG